MKTSSHRLYDGPGRVSIARGNRGVAGGFRIFRPLCPHVWMLRGLHDDRFTEVYRRDVLDLLDPQQTWDRLHALAAGAEPVLLCWEVPPFKPGNWCHRRQVAAWLEDALGVEVAELRPFF